MIKIKKLNLGELEREILEILWRTPELDAKALHAKIAVEKQISLNTVQSAAERLYKKQLLGRKKIKHAYQYYALLSRAELVGSLLEDVLKVFKVKKNDYFLQAFVDAADTLDESTLKKLEAVIRKKNKGNQ